MSENERRGAQVRSRRVAARWARGRSRALLSECDCRAARARSASRLSSSPGAYSLHGHDYSDQWRSQDFIFLGGANYEADQSAWGSVGGVP